MTYADRLTAEYPVEYDALKAVAYHSPDDAINSAMDAMLYLAIQRAAKAICNYTGWDTISAGYEGTTATLALQYLLADTSTARLFMGNPIIASQTQGSRSATYKADIPVFDFDGLTASVKATLPLPMLKVY